MTSLLPAIPMALPLWSQCGIFKADSVAADTIEPATSASCDPHAIVRAVDALNQNTNAPNYRRCRLTTRRAPVSTLGALFVVMGCSKWRIAAIA